MIFEKLDNLTDYKNSNGLLRLIDSLLSNIDELKRIAIIDSINIWKNMSDIINFPYMLDDTDLTEYLEIIASIKSTSHLVERYIEVKGQYWGSLSSYQTIEIYYDLMDYLLHLDGINRLKFFKEYFKIAYEISK